MNPDEEKITQRDSGFTFGCPECDNPPQHFTTKLQLDQHMKIHSETKNDLSKEGGSSFHLGDTDYKEGGSTIETLFCDMCSEEKTSEFKHLRGGFVSCSDCTEEKI